MSLGISHCLCSRLADDWKLDASLVSFGFTWPVLSIELIMFPRRRADCLERPRDEISFSQSSSVSESYFPRRSFEVQTAKSLYSALQNLGTLDLVS